MVEFTQNWSHIGKLHVKERLFTEKGKVVIVERKRAETEMSLTRRAFIRCLDCQILQMGFMIGFKVQQKASNVYN